MSVKQLEESMKMFRNACQPKFNLPTGKMTCEAKLHGNHMEIIIYFLFFYV